MKTLHLWWVEVESEEAVMVATTQKSVTSIWPLVIASFSDLDNSLEVSTVINKIEYMGEVLFAQ